MNEDIKRTKVSKVNKMKLLLQHQDLIIREENNRSFYKFLLFFWDVISGQEYQDNWHVKYICDILQEAATKVGERTAKVEDIIINIPPGTTKTIIVSIMFPVWCWTRWYWMRFITVSYSATLSLESAEYSRDLVRDDRFKQIYPDLVLKEDKDTKSNFKIMKLEWGINKYNTPKKLNGGNRFSTSIGGSLTGFHGDIIIWDDPLNPQEALSKALLEKANIWIDSTLPTRKTNKANTLTIGIMQRLHENDVTGHQLVKLNKKINHIVLPGDINEFGGQLKPQSAAKYYKDGLLDPRRLSQKVLDELKTDLGQYGYAGQIGQHPTNPAGGMFKVDNIVITTKSPNPAFVIGRCRYWDKAGTEGGGAYTTGVLMAHLLNGRWLIEDIVRGQWGTGRREDIMKQTAQSDGREVIIYIEQEPGSGGKESAENSIRNLAGFSVYADRPTGDKEKRADPYSVQVNNGNVSLLYGPWNTAYIEELRFFPVGRFKDQVDASSAAFNMLVKKKIAGRVF